MAESEQTPRHTSPKGNVAPTTLASIWVRQFRRQTKLYDMEGKNAAPLRTVLQHWGYKPQKRRWTCGGRGP